MSVTANIYTERQAQLQDLDIFIENSKKNITSILSRLGWSLESTTKDVRNYLVCPFDGSHRVPEQSLDKHLQECQWKAEGYGKHDLPLSLPSLPPGAPSSIKFDEQLQDEVIQSAKQKNPTMAIEHYHCYAVNGLDTYPFSIGASGRLIPRTSDRLITDFTREERCAMYEYVIANTVEPDIGDDIADINKPKSSNAGQKSSYLELLAQERNLKRRRAKYRGVHTNKKSQIEILREVVNQQMEMLAEYMSEKRNEVPENSTISAPVAQCPSDLLPEERTDGCSKRSERSNARYRFSDDRRESHERRETSADSKISSGDGIRRKKRDRDESSDRKPHNSSHKRRKYTSKDRHRSKSREREKIRSSKDRRENRHGNRDKRHDDRRSEWRRDDDRRPRKRSRSR